MKTPFLRNKPYSLIEYILVLAAILLSNSLYVFIFDKIILYTLFLIIMLIIFYLKRLKLNRIQLIFALMLLMLVLVNPETQYSSVLLLFVRLIISLIFISLIPFEKFTYIFTDILLLLMMFSLLSIPVIYFDIRSFLPVIATGVQEYENFIFFGVMHNFMLYDKFRINGLWWEPGAFQVFINLAFLFALLNNRITNKLFVFFLIVIIAVGSTTGLIVFLIFSFIYFYKKTSKSSIVILFTSLPPFLYVAYIYIIPKISEKFSSDSSSYSSFMGRYFDLVMSYEKWLETPWIGQGYGKLHELSAEQLSYGYSFGIYSLSGSDGLTVLIAQTGIFMCCFFIPFLWPKYLRKYTLLDKVLVATALIVMFNTENLTYTFLFMLLTLYGLTAKPVKPYLNTYN